MIKILILTGGSICMTTMLIAQLHMVAPTEATETSSAVLAKHIIDSTIYKHIQDGDSLKYQITQQVNTSTSYLIHTTDSLIRSTEDCLTSSSVDSLKQLQTSFLHSLQDYGALQQRSIDSTVRDRSTDLERYYWSAKHQSNSFNTTESIHDFFNTADSLSQFFRDSIMELYSIITGGLMDTTSFFQDSLATYTDRLTVDRESELDAIERSSSHIIVETESNSYPSYHGRDGGVRQISFSPTMTYRHTSGASLSVGSTWFEKQAAHWDETEAQIGYDYFSSSTLEASLAYTHFWFDSSTTQLRSVFKNSIDAEIDISSSILDYGLIANMDFGNHSDMHFN